MNIARDPSLTFDWLERLTSSGYRVTGPRRAIVELMALSQKALSPIEVYDQARIAYPGLGLVTVYRTLERLEELAFVQRVHQPDGCHRYLRATQGHQHLLVCTSCGQVVYFSGDDLKALAGRVSRDTGYEVQDHWLQLFGLCPVCQADEAA